jgi:hypothetical protein
VTDSPSLSRRAALFVDGDNLPPSMAEAILSAAGRIGRLDLRRVYAAEPALKGWAAVPGLRTHVVAGAKNGTDLALCIDAVEAACAGGVEAFAIASDDRDFTHLAHWLRERGRQVLGIGTAKSSGGWRAACTDFVTLERPEAPKTARSHDPLDLKLRDLIHGEGGPSGLAIGVLGVRMGTIHRVTLTSLGVSGWRAYLQGRPMLYALDPKGAGARVRWIGG